ncbi:MAG: ribonuclease P protein component [Alphaproteobacteria bacterium]|nr:ribonuclease P protein component [Alphaproteobacteria bacterium]
MNNITHNPPLLSLRTRAQFLGVAKGKKQVQRGLIVQAIPNDSGNMRFGMTATKKIGNAVIRNRVRRRFRVLAKALLPLYGQSGFDYVLVGRIHSAKRKWQDLHNDLGAALKLIHKGESGNNKVENNESEK